MHITTREYYRMDVYTIMHARKALLNLFFVALYRRINSIYGLIISNLAFTGQMI